MAEVATILAAYLVALGLACVVVAGLYWWLRPVEQESVAVSPAPDLTALEADVKALLARELAPVERKARPVVTLRCEDQRGRCVEEIRVPAESRRPTLKRGLKVFQVSGQAADGAWVYRLVGEERTH